MAYIYQMVDTWNNNAVNFDAIRMSVTDTTSGSSSNLFNLLINGVEKFTIDKSGSLFGGAAPNITFTINGRGPDVRFTGSGAQIGCAINDARIGFRLISTGWFSWSPDGSSNSAPDTGMLRVSPGLIEINNGVTASYSHLVLFTNRTVGVTFASLPTPASVSVGGRAMITNGAAATFNTTAAGGGANVVPVFSDGTQWKYG